MSPFIWYLVATFAAIAAALGLTPLAIRFARAAGVIDLPGARKVHGTPTPRTGGLAVAIAMAITATAVLLLSHAPGLEPEQGLARLITLAGAGLFILLVGFADDIFDIPGKYKLLALLAASLAVAASGTVIREIGIASTAKLHLGMAAWPVTVLWIVGITVSLNFIDGLDGLAAGLAALACAALAIASGAAGAFPICVLCLALLGSLLGFLVFNFNPARIFLGDSGSMFIGFMVGCCSVWCVGRIGTTAGLILPGLALSIPILDAALTMVRRGVLHRRSVFSAERGHIHHRLLDLGLCQKHVVLILYGVSALAAGVGLAGLFEARWVLLGGLMTYALTLYALLRVAGSVRARETVRAIRRNRAIARESNRYNRAFEEMQTRFRAAGDFGAWWAEVLAAADMFDFVSVALPLRGRDGSRRTAAWRRQDAGDCRALSVKVPIRHRRVGPALQAVIEVAAPGTLESAGRRVALFARLMDEYGLNSLPQSPNRAREEIAKDPAPAAESVRGELVESVEAACADLARGEFARGEHVESVESAKCACGEPAGCACDAAANCACGESAESVEASKAVESALGLPPDRIARLAADTLALADGPASGLDDAPDSADLWRPAAPSGRSVPGFLGPHRSPRVAIVHDFLYTYGGAERVLEQMLRVFPDADLFSLFDFLPPGKRDFIRNKTVRTSFIQHLPLARRKHRGYLPLMPLAVEQLDVSAYDIVISSSYVAAKGVITRPGQLHVSYCHSPVRFAWDLQHQYLAEAGIKGGLKAMIVRMILQYIRNWDARSAGSVDVFLTNSRFVSQRVEKCYRRRSTPLYPPVDTRRFTPADPGRSPAPREDYYLSASRLVPYKRTDLIVEAFTRMPDRRLIVVGEGPEFDRLRAAPPATSASSGASATSCSAITCAAPAPSSSPPRKTSESSPSRPWPAARRSSPTAAAGSPSPSSRTSPACSSPSSPPPA